jgi:hypothetical protein
MSHPETHGHDTHASTERPHFSAAEWEQFQKDDVTAGGAIVLLMGGIFSIGLILYFIVAWSVRTAPFYQG